MLKLDILNTEGCLITENKEIIKKKRTWATQFSRLRMEKVILLIMWKK